jgi:hypothetical protein
MVRRKLEVHMHPSAYCVVFFSSSSSSSSFRIRFWRRSVEPALPFSTLVELRVAAAFSTSVSSWRGVSHLIHCQWFPKLQSHGAGGEALRVGRSVEPRILEGGPRGHGLGDTTQWFDSCLLWCVVIISKLILYYYIYITKCACQWTRRTSSSQSYFIMYLLILMLLTLIIYYVIINNSFIQCINDSLI